MGKIRVQDLARIMGIANQDLIFKLRSIGVRVESENAEIDTDVIQAVLQGKKLPHPREVILRDEASQPSPEQQKRTSARRVPVSPLRPTRRRTIIQKVEPRIKTLPVTERPAPAQPEPTPEETPASAAPLAETPTADVPTAPPEVVHPEKEEKPPIAPPAAEVQKPVEVAAAPTRKPKAASKRPKGTKRPAVAVQEAGVRERRAAARAAQEAAEPKKEEVPVSRRRRRRAERRQAEEAEGKILEFKRPRSEGPITISEGMTVREFADKLGVKSKDLIKALFERGFMASINHVLEPELAEQLARELGFEALVVTFEEEVQLQEESQQGKSEGRTPRAPVVTIMGHVDHGKTSLLDGIRSSRVTESEFGGITQHIGAYHVEVNDRKIVFLDTPGHEAFTRLRARGAKVTDIVVLVVAADDGVMPQTVEAMDHAKAAGVPIVVAINKIDKPNANPDRVRKELSERGLTVEAWGGDTVAVEISAKEKVGIEELLEMILLTADLLDLKANTELSGQGVVLEARKEVGRGIVATALVQDGTLRSGDVFVSGATWGRVRTMSDDLGHRLHEAGPATPVEITGLSELPEAGDPFQVVPDEVKARAIAEFRHQEMRRRELAAAPGKISLEQLFDQISQGEIKELPVVLKADVQGSVEVLRETLEKLSTDQVKVRVLHAGVGGISTNDVLLASASRAIIYGFNVRPERNATELAEKEQVDVRTHTVIYELSDELKKAMTGLLEPTFREVAKGRAEVRETFKVPKVGTVAGCHVVEGSIPRGALVRLLRDNRVIYEGKIASLRRFKDDAAEVRTGFDCGIGLDRFQDLKPGDFIEAFVREEVAPAL